jgi:hypothetical protein
MPQLCHAFRHPAPPTGLPRKFSQFYADISGDSGFHRTISIGHGAGYTGAEEGYTLNAAPYGFSVLGLLVPVHTDSAACVFPNRSASVNCDYF